MDKTKEVFHDVEDHFMGSYQVKKINEFMKKTKDKTFQYGVYSVQSGKGMIKNFTQKIEQYKHNIILKLNEYKSVHYGVKCAFEKIRPGEHIYLLRTKPIVYEHHGIYAGHGRVVHFVNNQVIKETSLKYFAHGNIVRHAPNLYI